MRDLKQIYSNLREHQIIDAGEDGLAAVLTTNNLKLRVIFSYGGEWEHASVSLINRCPIWKEMCFVKDFFWKQDEVVVQYHPAKEDYINNFTYCLHLWRPQNQEVPMPPKIFV